MFCLYIVVGIICCINQVGLIYILSVFVKHLVSSYYIALSLFFKRVVYKKNAQSKVIYANECCYSLWLLHITPLWTNQSIICFVSRLKQQYGTIVYYNSIHLYKYQIGNITAWALANL